MRRAPLFAIAALAAAAPATAAAAPPWSAPQNLSSASTFVDDVGVGFSADGTALATWRWGQGVGNTATGGRRGATRSPGADTFAAQRNVPGFAAITPAGRGGAILANVAGTTRLRVRFGRSTGAFGTRRTVARGKRIVAVSLAANARGDAALAWFDDRGVRTDRVYVAVRRPGRNRFGAPTRLTTGRIRSVSVAVGPRGDVLVAWDARGVVRTRFRRAGARRFRPTDTIRSQNAFFANLRTAVGATGRAAVGWGSQFLSEGGSVGVVRYQAAIRPPGAKRFRAAQLLERQSASQRAEGVAVAFDAAGRALFAWTGFDGTNYRARVATAAGNVFGAPETLSPPGIDAIVDDLAAAPDGDALAVWEQHPSLDSEPGQIFAALRPAQDAFGPPEAVSALEQARVARAAFDPRTARPTVVWSNRPGPSGPGVPIAQIKTYAQAATRLG